MKRNHLACLSVELPVAASVPDAIQLFPAGSFRATDGRPTEIDAWYLDAEGAKRLIDQAAARDNPCLIDYEHQTLLTKNNGQPAPASGWFKGLEWRAGSGLWAVGVQWTARASSMITAREYRYISPVFMYDKKGHITRLLHAALTNDPALDGMAAVAALTLITPPHSDPLPLPRAGEGDQPKLKDTPMNAEILELLGLAEDATEDQALQALKDTLARLDAFQSGMADLKAQSVPMDALLELQNKMAALSAQTLARDIDDLVKPALDDGRLLPTMETWARDLGKTHLASLRQFIDNATPLAALGGMQSRGNPAKGNTPALSEDELTACRLLGQSQDEYLAFKTTLIKE